jgi:tetratricopeptide repeat protein 8
MDPLFLAYSYFRRRKFKESADICTKLLEKNPYDQVTDILSLSSVQFYFEFFVSKMKAENLR